MRIMRLFAHVLIAALIIQQTACSSRKTTSSPEELLKQGWQAYRLADYDIAIRHFDQALESSGTSAQSKLMALYGKAVTWDLRQPVPSQDDERARTIYQQIIAEAPDHELAGWSALAIARMSHLVPVDQEPDYEKVYQEYQNVIDRFARHPAGQEALIYQQSTIIQTLEPESTRAAIERLRQFIHEYPQSPFTSAAWNLIAQGYETLADYGQMLEAQLSEIKTVEVDPNNPSVTDFSWRYWQIATTAEFKVGRFDIAREYYQKLIDEYPLDFRKFPSRQALARMDAVEKDLRAEAGP